MRGNFGNTWTHGAIYAASVGTITQLTRSHIIPKSPTAPTLGQSMHMVAIYHTPSTNIYYRIKTATTEISCTAEKKPEKDQLKRAMIERIEKQISDALCSWGICTISYLKAVIPKSATPATLKILLKL
jgi:hypothetical protein